MLEAEFVLDEAARGRLLSRFGDGVREWCAGLPRLVEHYCSQWDLRLEQARSGSTSRVYFGWQRAQPARPARPAQPEREVVLKVTPESSIAREEAAALRAWAATPHAVALLDADPDGGALLLERVRPGTKLWDAGALPPAAEMAELLTGLRVAAGDLTGQLPPQRRHLDRERAATVRFDSPVRILGIDPALRVTGYGIVERSGSRVRLIEAGVVAPKASRTLAERLRDLHTAVGEIIAQTRPDILVVEELYSTYKNPSTAILMGHARGVLYLAGAQAGLPVETLAHSHVKRSLTGSGSARKEQVNAMVRHMLGLRSAPHPLDVSDALALALAYLNVRDAQRILAAG